MARLPVLATCLALALVPSACGDDDDPSPPSGAGGKAADTVGMKNIQFSPGEVTVKVGETVSWVNEEEVEHNVVATEGATFKSKLLGLDGTFEYKAEKPGTISYVCTIHSGMAGKIIVQ